MSIWAWVHVCVLMCMYTNILISLRKLNISPTIYTYRSVYISIYITEIIKYFIYYLHTNIHITEITVNIVVSINTHAYINTNTHITDIMWIFDLLFVIDHILHFYSSQRKIPASVFFFFNTNIYSFSTSLYHCPSSSQDTFTHTLITC